MNAAMKTLAAAALALAATAAHATTGWTEIVNPATSGFSFAGNTVSYSLSSGAVASDVWATAAGNTGPQSAASIEALIDTQYKLPSSGAGSLSLTGQNDNLDSVKSGSFTVDSSFNYLAVHFGNGELLFQFAAPVAAGTVFNFAGLPNGVSNYRAFTTGVSAVPEPATYAMLLGGLGLVGAIARRRKQA